MVGDEVGGRECNVTLAKSLRSRFRAKVRVLALHPLPTTYTQPNSCRKRQKVPPRPLLRERVLKAHTPKQAQSSLFLDSGLNSALSSSSSQAKR